MIKPESRTRILASSFAFILGPLALTGCTPDYDGWHGCEQAEIRPGPANVRLNINARLIELNKGNRDLVNDSTHFAADTSKDAMDAIFSIYDQVYDREYMELQAGDKVPFCVTKDGVKSFDLGGTIEVKAHDYNLADNSWQAVTVAQK